MLKIKGSLNVACMKARHRFNFPQSCFVALVTLLVRKAIVGWMSGRARLDTYRSFCTMLWKILRLCSGRRGELGSVSKQEAEAGVLGVALRSSPKARQ